MDFPILEFDPDRGAILNPPGPKDQPIPARGLLCFFADVLAERLQRGELRQIGRLASEIGPNPIYETTLGGQRLFVVHPGVGAPLAAGFLEELIALGARQIVAVGGCGALSASIDAGHPVLITSAVRDEGTSYHYLPPGREASPDPVAADALRRVLRRRGIEFREGKTWTTDAIYRETEIRRARRVAEGCVVVEMEAAAFFAVAAFRGAQLAQLVYGGDLVVPEGWDGRGWHRRSEIRSSLYEIGLEAAAEMQQG